MSPLPPKAKYPPNGSKIDLICRTVMVLSTTGDYIIYYPSGIDNEDPVPRMAESAAEPSNTKNELILVYFPQGDNRL